MRIGILTLHWAPNFGAVLQAYALQYYLKDCGHDAFIINYKPYNRNHNLTNMILNRKFNHPFAYMREAAKDRRLERFRSEYLVRSRRYGRLDELRADPPAADMYISGSDQVMHPRTLLKGERKPVTSYFLDFGSPDTLRCGYALSFGCTSYPQGPASVLAASKIGLFDRIGVREDTAVGIVRSLGYGHDAVVVPDPVILAGRKAFDSVVAPQEIREQYVATYFLHGRSSLSESVKNDLSCDVKDVDAAACDIPGWIRTIISGRGLVTNSYHGVAFALLYHVPFVAVLESGVKGGMNDRFLTLLKRCSLEHRVLEQYKSEELVRLFTENIDWNDTDRQLDVFRASGADFISGLCKGSV